MTPQEKLEQYSKEITEDLKLNEMVIQQKSFEIPQRKHYWVTKLILETQELNKLERKKRKVLFIWFLLDSTTISSSKSILTEGV